MDTKQTITNDEYEQIERILLKFIELPMIKKREVLEMAEKCLKE